VFYLQIALVVLAVILEQKNIMRSIDNQISFLGIMFFIFICSDVLNYIKIKKSYILIIFMFCMWTLFFSLSRRNTQFYISVNAASPQRCMDKNLNNLLLTGEYKKLFSVLRENNVEKIYTYPDEPALYALFKQDPPFYFDIYAGSALDGQTRRINYLKDNNIKTIVINTKNNSVQDSVPNYIRAPKETEYILNNYYPLETVGSYLILGKSEFTDFFNYKFQSNQIDFQKYLLNVNLESIPLSEGYYKKKALGEIIFSAKNIDLLNDYLMNLKVLSKNKLLVLIPDENSSSNLIKVMTVDGRQTSISLKACRKGQFCIVNLNNVPLLYRNRTIKQIKIDSFIGEIRIYNVNTNSIIW
jgi:hypothetical protein